MSFSTLQQHVTEVANGLWTSRPTCSGGWNPGLSASGAGLILILPLASQDKLPLRLGLSIPLNRDIYLCSVKCFDLHM